MFAEGAGGRGGCVACATFFVSLGCAEETGGWAVTFTSSVFFLERATEGVASIRVGTSANTTNH